MLCRSAAQVLGTHALCSTWFLMPNSAISKRNSVHKLHLIKNWLVDSSDRDHSESPRKFMMGHKNNGSEEWKSTGSLLQHACTTSKTSAYCCHSALSGAVTAAPVTSLSCMVTVHTYTELLRFLTSRISDHHDALLYGKMAAVSVRCMCTGSYPT